MVVELTNGVASREVTLRNVGQPLAVGNKVSVFGVVQAEGTILVTEVVIREPWEAVYMYVVSFLAGLWVLARLLNGWTVDKNHWTIAPRSSTVLAWRDEEDA